MLFSCAELHGVFEIAVKVGEVGLELLRSAGLPEEVPRTDLKLDHVRTDGGEERHVVDDLLKMAESSEEEGAFRPFAVFGGEFGKRKPPVSDRPGREFPGARRKFSMFGLFDELLEFIERLFDFGAGGCAPRPR